MAVESQQSNPIKDLNELSDAIVDQRVFHSSIAACRIDELSTRLVNVPKEYVPKLRRELNEMEPDRLVAAIRSRLTYSYRKLKLVDAEKGWWDRPIPEIVQLRSNRKTGR